MRLRLLSRAVPLFLWSCENATKSVGKAIHRTHRIIGWHVWGDDPRGYRHVRCEPPTPRLSRRAIRESEKPLLVEAERA